MWCALPSQLHLDSELQPHAYVKQSSGQDALLLRPIPQRADDQLGQPCAQPLTLSQAASKSCTPITRDRKCCQEALRVRRASPHRPYGGVVLVLSQVLRAYCRRDCAGTAAPSKKVHLLRQVPIRRFTVRVGVARSAFHSWPKLLQSGALYREAGRGSRLCWSHRRRLTSDPGSVVSHSSLELSSRQDAATHCSRSAFEARNRLGPTSCANCRS